MGFRFIENMQNKVSKYNQRVTNTTKDVKKSATKLGSTTMEMIFGMHKLPWKKLPIMGWLCIIGFFFFLLFLLIVAFPM